MPHGSSSIETLYGEKYYHYNGILVARLMSDESLYYLFDDKLNPTSYTDKTGTIWSRADKSWKKQQQFLPGKRVSITATQKYIEEKWEDPFGTFYIFRNGMLYEQNCSDGTIFRFPYGIINDRQMIHGSDCTYMSIRVRIDENNNWWESINNITTKISKHADGKTITTICSRVIDSTQNVADYMRTAVEKVYISHPVDQILAQITPFIPTNLEDQRRWITEMLPAFEEYQRKDKIRQIIDGKIQDAEFLPSASELDLNAYQQALTDDFYNSFTKALRVGQTLRLFKLDHSRINSFATSVGKTKAELLLYCYQTLYNNNPDHIKLLGEVNWL